MYPNFFDPTLKEIIPSNTDSGIVLNKSFSDQKDHIEPFIQTRDHKKAMDILSDLSLGGKKLNPVLGSELFEAYSFGSFKQLYLTAMEHISDNERDLKKDSTIVLVHPFYLQFSHMNKVKMYGREKEVIEYGSRLKNLLNSSIKDNFNIVILETLHHYLAGTSRLLEEGIIDSVFLTKFDCGSLAQKSDGKKLINQKIYLGGGYNERCFSTAIKEVYFETRTRYSRVRGLRDLVVNHPASEEGLLDPKTIYFGSYSFLDDSEICISRDLY